MIVCGIDPGLSSGAVAFYGYGLVESPKRVRLLSVTEIPTVGEGSAKRIDVHYLRQTIHVWKPNIAYIEDGQTMPGQASGSMGRYLRACGAIEATVALADVDAVFVRPTVWKRALDLLGQDKRASLALARKWFPEHAVTTFKLQKSHNLAEAALLAVYGASRCEMIRLEAA